MFADDREALIDPTGHMFQYSNSAAGGGIDVPISNGNLNDEGGNTIAVLLQNRNNPFLTPTANTQQYGPPAPATTSTASSYACVGTFAPLGSVCGISSSRAGAILVTIGFFAIGGLVGAGAIFAAPTVVGAGFLATISGFFFGAGLDASANDLQAGRMLLLWELSRLEEAASMRPHFGEGFFSIFTSHSVPIMDPVIPRF